MVRLTLDVAGLLAWLAVGGLGLSWLLVWLGRLDGLQLGEVGLDWAGLGCARVRLDRLVWAWLGRALLELPLLGRTLRGFAGLRRMHWFFLLPPPPFFLCHPRGGIKRVA